MEELHVHRLDTELLPHCSGRAVHVIEPDPAIAAATLEKFGDLLKRRSPISDSRNNVVKFDRRGHFRPENGPTSPVGHLYIIERRVTASALAESRCPNKNKSMISGTERYSLPPSVRSRSRLA
jgi:hypothetical protein